MKDKTGTGPGKRPSARRIGSKEGLSKPTISIPVVKEGSEHTDSANRNVSLKRSKKRIATRRGVSLESSSPPPPIPKRNDKKEPVTLKEAYPTKKTESKKRSSSKGIRISTQLSTIERGLDALFNAVNDKNSDDQDYYDARQAIDRIASRLDATRFRDDNLAVSSITKQLLSSEYKTNHLGLSGLEPQQLGIDEFGMNAVYQTQVRPILEFLYRYYFKVQVKGIENIPSVGSVLLVCNHGSIIPLDGPILRTTIQFEHPTRREMRWLIEESISNTFYVGTILNRLGAVFACRENAERLLSQNEVLAVFPEGVAGKEKLYHTRHILKKFRKVGYIRLALRMRVPVIPVAIVGAEDAYPLFYKVKTLPKMLGLPYLPITPLFPWLGPLGLLPLPSRWRIAVGEIIEDFTAHDYKVDEDNSLVEKLNQEVYHRLQTLMDIARK